ncbi:hypothetical protein [Amycolatopsis cihanbeyliensis]|nr:hypothetical protein [Amycolatopsis cihanbeyliensis]
MPEVRVDRQLDGAGEILRYEGLASGVCKPNIGSWPAESSSMDAAITMHTVTGWSDAQRHMTGNFLSLVMPFRLSWLADRIDSPDTVMRSLSRRERRTVKSALQKRGYKLIATTDDAAFEDFYTQVYLPTMRDRHGEQAKGETEETARECMFRRRGVLLLMRDPNLGTVGGALCRYGDRGQSLVMRLVGVRNADPDLYRDGSFKALWILVLQWASSQGFRSVDLKGTEPFVSNGNFQWKRRIGARVGPLRNFMSGHRIVFTVNSDGPGVRSFLVAHPLVEITDAGALGAVCFHDRNAPPQSPGYYAARGISTIRYLDLETMRWSSAEPLACSRRTVRVQTDGCEGEFRSEH